MSLFDKNGNAIETHVATVSSYDAMTGEFIDTYDVRIIDGTGIPAFSTLTIAPEPEKGFAHIWNGQSWDAVPDYRGMTAYIKESGAGVTVRDIGELAETLTLIKPLTPFDKWDGMQWVTDTDAQHASDVATADAEKQSRIDQANDYMNNKQWPGKSALGRMKDTEKGQYNLWLDYLDALEAVDTSSAPDIKWPTPPAH
ncbi:tail fiber assembly protein [Citrobacter sp. RHBSTW-00944]|nr:tail fiber assembly protein [Citrobacter sp. RHBSTW-00944]QLO82474.1 tail fiber assembly protein [Citrobacter sp. RHBSTW-00944]